MKKKSIFLRVGAVFLAALIATICVIPAFAAPLFNDVSVSELAIGSVVTNGYGDGAILGFDVDTTLIFTKPRYGYVNSVPGHYIGQQIFAYPYDPNFNGVIPENSYPTIKYDNGVWTFGYSTPIDSGWVFTSKKTFTQQGTTLELVGPPNEQIAILYNSAISGENMYNAGYTDGYNDGYAVGENDGLQNQQGFFTGALSVIMSPITFIQSILNFEVFGLNLWGLFTGIATIGLVIFVLKKIGVF